MPRDKLHRRNPLTVRQEVQSFNDAILDITLPDIELNEMPGLQNPEEWKRIATRNIPMASPLSLEYHQQTVSVIERPEGEKQVVLRTNYQSASTNHNNNMRTKSSKIFCRSHRHMLFCAAIVPILITIVISVVVTVVLVRKHDETITDYYSGSVFVAADFNPVLASISSTLSKNYQQEFCSLISATLINLKTKYAVFYASCTLTRFRNGSIVGDFVLGFTRYQNVTRLNAFLNRTISYKQLFGGTVVSIVFNFTTVMNTSSIHHNVTAPTTLNGSKSGGTPTIVANALSTTPIIQHSNGQNLQITYSTTDKGSSLNIIVTTNNKISPKDTNQHYKCVFVPIFENATYSFVFTNDTLNSSSHLANAQLDDKQFSTINNRKINTKNAGLTSESILNNALPLNTPQYKRSRRLEHHASPKQLLLSQQDYHVHQPSFSDNSSISLTTVSSRSSSPNSLEDSWPKDRVDKLAALEPLSSNKKLAILNTKTKYFSTSDGSFNTVQPLKHSIAEPIPLRDESSSTITHPTSKKTTSNNLSYRNSTQKLLHMSLLSNGRTQKAVDELPYITQESINRSLLQNKSNTHDPKQSSNHLGVKPITNKKRTIKHNHSSNIGQQNQALDNKNKTVKYKILNLLRFIR
ncbi:unnamed protein product [Rotaria socialis]|uniref:SEA domain-containing protein n=1 Tax=Rotaria socialis TaxID=392032 RepID=A0A818EIZ3_9BILA|nr:unnamed protein product [Rotaria socialis]CAF3459667.1 unnamed protein product [Rotaria socialis]